MSSENILELKRLSKKLTETENELSAFWNLCPALLCIAGVDGNFLRVNPAWTRLLGWTEQELVSRPYKSFIHPDDIEKTIRAEKHIREDPLNNFYNRYVTVRGDYKTIEWFTSRYIDQSTTYAFALEKR